jgi:hypothetical protein
MEAIMIKEIKGDWTLTDLFLTQSDFYTNPSKKSLKKLERSLDIYLKDHLITSETKRHILIKATEYLKEAGNE